MPKVGPRQEGHGCQKFRGIGVGRLQSIWPGGTEGRWEQIYRPWDFLGHLKGTQRSGKLSHSLSLFLVTEEEQDNVGFRQQGSGYFRAATLGLGGARSVRDATCGHTERTRTSRAAGAGSSTVWASSLRGGLGQCHTLTTRPRGWANIVGKGDLVRPARSALARCGRGRSHDLG